MLDWLYNTLLQTGSAVATTWLTVLVVAMSVLALSRIITQIKKIQGRKLRWSTLRHELMWSAVNISCTAVVLKYVSATLVSHGLLVTDPSPVPWYTVLFEFALFFFVFDLYFYIVHRTVHIEPLYTWIHRIHHRSTAPNPLSSSSMSPVEGILEGIIIPIFLSAFTVHEKSMMFIIPFATIMGLYVHCGYEMAPKWWYKTWATRWFITPMFHDQHHQYVTCNYGGFTTIWDWVFGTVRPKFLEDFNKLKRGGNSSPAQPETL
jgi:Delta7-sterol 5-desaturase